MGAEARRVTGNFVCVFRSIRGRKRRQTFLLSQFSDFKVCLILSKFQNFSFEDLSYKVRRGPLQFVKVLNGDFHHESVVILCYV